MIVFNESCFALDIFFLIYTCCTNRVQSSPVKLLPALSLSNSFAIYWLLFVKWIFVAMRRH